MRRSERTFRPALIWRTDIFLFKSDAAIYSVLVEMRSVISEIRRRKKDRRKKEKPKP